MYSWNNFVPEIPQEHVDVIYLCYPNNPTGTTLTYNELRKWVDYALENDAIILYDAAYEAYIQNKDIPHSIYEIENADFEILTPTSDYQKIALLPDNKLLLFDGTAWKVGTIENKQIKNLKKVKPRDLKKYQAMTGWPEAEDVAIMILTEE